MIGMKYGGALGAAIGAGAGAVAGIVRLFMGDATRKVREKINATYGIDVRDKGVLQQIADTAKQGFGGNIDMAIRSQEVRDQIELYGMTTGQSLKGMPAKMTPLTLSQSGGALSQAGASYGPLASPGAAMALGPASTTINITIPGAKDFFEKESVKVVVGNPKAVQSAAVAATRKNVDRRQMAALQLSPGTIVS